MRKLFFILILLSFPALNAKAECCPGLEYFIGFIAVIAGLPLLIGLFILLASLNRLKKALKYVSLVWIITLVLYGGFYLISTIPEDEYLTYSNRNFEQGILYIALLPISVLLAFTLIMYLIKLAINNFIQANREHKQTP